MGLSSPKWVHKLAYIVCIYLDVSGCLQLSVLGEFQILSVVLGQCPGGQLDAFPGITRSSSQRALGHPSWYLLPVLLSLCPVCFCTVEKTASGGTLHIFKSPQENPTAPCLWLLRTLSQKPVSNSQIIQQTSAHCLIIQKT